MWQEGGESIEKRGIGASKGKNGRKLMLFLHSLAVVIMGSEALDVSYVIVNRIFREYSLGQIGQFDSLFF